jgi:triosephosphate isomerase
MRKPIVAGNWKMNTNAGQAGELAAALVQMLGRESQAEIVVCPPFPYLTRVAAAVTGSQIALGAQNVHSSPNGAFTGEVSAAMLVDCGCKWVIIGHSERRQLLGESDDFIWHKLIAALAAGLHVILCVGETLVQRQTHQTEMIVETQLTGSLERLTREKLARVVLAYEPIWAIGTGHNATPEQAQQVHQFIRSWLDGQFGDGAAQATRILYGGSVKPENAAGLLAQPDVDGALVGGASLIAADFVAIARAAVEMKLAS